MVPRPESNAPPSAATTGGRAVLFISYDGVLGGPGRSQTIPYLRGYAAAGWSVHLLSYEKPELLDDGTRREPVERELAENGIAWTRLRWRGVPWRDLRQGLRAVREIVERSRPDVLHARSYVPALLADRAGRRHGARLLFDMRGFWPDERVDGGLWSRRHPLYVLWKRIERGLLRRSDAVVTLARAGLEVLWDEGLLDREVPHAVVYCGADLERFRPVPAEERPAELDDWNSHRVWTFLGATGTWYLLDAMLDFVADTAAVDPASRFLFLTEDPESSIRDGLAARGVSPELTRIRRVPHEDVPAWISGSWAGVFFIKPCRSKKASCPTKLAEFLACGVPVVTNAGIGDVDEIVRRDEVGAVAADAAAGDWGVLRDRVAVLRSDPALPDRCRRVATSTFDAREGAAGFVALAERVLTR